MKLNLHLTMRELHASTKALILVVAACFSIETQAQFNVPVPYNPDGTADGFIGVEDLIELLAIFGSEFDSSALVSDSTSAIVHLGEGDYFDCAAWCSELQGNWKVLDEIVVGRYKDEISNMVAEGNSAWLDARSVLGTNYQRAPRVRPSDWYLGESTYNTNHQCICQTRVIEPIVIQAGPCNGLVDLCGICNGPGPVYECGCYEMAEGACDCEGNQLDALGECGGNCIGDFDGDGVCDSFAGGACANEESLDYHGFEYDLVEIGDQCWFAQDLRTLQYSNGDSIVIAHTNAEWQSTNDASIGATSAYAGYEFNGSVYNWHSVFDERGLCPSGWSVPSRAEFQVLGETVALTNTSNGYDVPWVTTALKDDQTWNGTNLTGFSATYTVKRGPTGTWYDSSPEFWLWSTTNGVLGQAYFFRLTANNNAISSNNTGTLVQDDTSVGSGHAIRCLKDSE